MSESIVHAVRFSPIPQIGERLNIAVMGLNLEERNAGAMFHDIERVQLVFGPESGEQVLGLFHGIRSWTAAVRQQLLSDSSREVRPISDSVRDKGLTVILSEPIYVFEGTLQDALGVVAGRYLVGSGARSTEKENSQWGDDLAAFCSQILGEELSRRDFTKTDVAALVKQAKKNFADLFPTRASDTPVLPWAKGIARSVARSYKETGDTKTAWDELAGRGPIGPKDESSLRERLI